MPWPADPIAGIVSNLLDAVQGWNLERQNSRIARRSERRVRLMAKAGGPPMGMLRWDFDTNSLKPDPAEDAKLTRELQVELVLAQIDSDERMGDNLARATWALVFATAGLIVATIVIASTA